MKKVIFAVVIFTTIGLTNSFGQDVSTKIKEKTTISTMSFGVRGNCGMCQKTIEKAANSVEGVSKAIWDKENVMGDLDAYKGLSACCKYDHEMEMNQKTEAKSEHQH